LASDRTFFRLRDDDRGAVMVETTIIAFLLVFLPFAVAEFGLAWWQWNAAEKATQFAVQRAVTSSPVATELATFTCGNADIIPGTPCSAPGATSFGTITCSGASSSCSGGYSFDAVEFARLRTRMQSIDPTITSANIVVEYRDVGLGFAGRSTPVPLVSVRLVNMTFNFIAMSAFIEGPITMPEFRATLTGEDLSTAGVS
jgi:Flp pilus assembly protein TadG